MTEPVTITLTPGEIMLVRILASLRAGVNRTLGTPDAKRGPQDGYDTDLLGVAGEVAFAKHFNLFPDLTFDPRSGGHDFTLGNGRTVDVKTTARENGNLLVTPSKRGNPSDLYALVTGKLPTFTFRGYAHKSLVFGESLKDLGRGPCYLVEQGCLSPIGELNLTPFTVL